MPVSSVNKRLAGESDFSHALNGLGPFSSKPHFAIAVSGGADSMALALMAQTYVAEHGGMLTALTVDHGLRPESKQESEQVAKWMAARGIAHVTLTPDHPDISNNLMEAARQWRYDALADWCTRNGVLHCLLAHHRNDQDETIALNTARGITADGSSGMPAVRNYHGVRFLRPLLGTSKEELVAFLTSEKTKWIEDPTNKDLRFARARLRTTALTAVASDAPAREARDHAIAEAAAQCVMLSPLGYSMLDLVFWRELAPELRSQLIADLLTAVSGNIHRPRGHETERVAGALMQKDSKPCTLHGCLVKPRKNSAIIEREIARVAAPTVLEGAGVMMWDNRFRVRYDLPRPATLRAMGDDAKALHVPPATPSLWHLDELLYVPHIMRAETLPPEARVSMGFAPAKPLAAAPFWWFNRG